MFEIYNDLISFEYSLEEENCEETQTEVIIECVHIDGESLEAGKFPAAFIKALQNTVLEGL